MTGTSYPAATDTALPAPSAHCAPPATAPTTYGVGLSQLGPLYGHTGALPGYNSFMGYDPVNRVTVVAWGNLAPAANGFPHVYT